MTLFIAPTSPWVHRKAVIRAAISNRFVKDSSCSDGYDYSAPAKSCALIPCKRISMSKNVPRTFATTANREYLHPPYALNSLHKDVDMPVAAFGIINTYTEIPHGDATETSSQCQQSQSSAIRPTQEGANSPHLIDNGSNFCFVGQAKTFIPMRRVTSLSRHSTIRREDMSSISLTYNTIMERSNLMNNTHTSGIVERANSGRYEHVDHYNCSIINVNSCGHIDSGQVAKGTAGPLTVTATRGAELARNSSVIIETGLERCSPPESQTLHNPISREEVDPGSIVDFIYDCSPPKRTACSMKSPSPPYEQNEHVNDEREQRYEERLVMAETDFEDGRYGTCHECGSPIVIPGLAQFYCAKCGWIRRPVDMKSIAPGHHD